MKFIIHMHVKKSQPKMVRVLWAYQTFLFSPWNFVNRLKQTFLQINLLVVADTEPVQIQRRLICRQLRSVFVFSRPAAHVMSSFLYTIGLFVRPQKQRERNVVRFSAALVGRNVP